MGADGAAPGLSKHPPAGPLPSHCAEPAGCNNGAFHHSRIFPPFHSVFYFTKKKGKNKFSLL